jgi:hypothetical protein
VEAGGIRLPPLRTSLVWGAGGWSSPRGQVAGPPPGGRWLVLPLGGGRWLVLPPGGRWLVLPPGGRWLVLPLGGRCLVVPPGADTTDGDGI